MVTPSGWGQHIILADFTVKRIIILYFFINWGCPKDIIHSQIIRAIPESKEVYVGRRGSVSHTWSWVKLGIDEHQSQT